MKLLLILSLLFFSSKSYSQGIEQGEFAVLLYQDIYPNGTVSTGKETWSQLFIKK